MSSSGPASSVAAPNVANEVKLPEIAHDAQKSRKSSHEMRNPFTLPSDDEVFQIREADRKERLAQRERVKNLSVYEKGVVKRLNFKNLLDLPPDEEDLKLQETLRKRDADKIILSRQMRDRHFGRENLHDFIDKKREMFLVQYALGVKREEMKKLEEIALVEEQKLLDNEKKLDEDAAKFDAFLKENDKNSVEAIRRAEKETKAKMEKIAEIKKYNMQIMSIRSEMSKNEEQLKEYQRYKEFLDKLTPQEWLDKNRGAGKEARMYFTRPQQLLDIFVELEESNLGLIQNCQEHEETLEELKQKIGETEERMDQETSALTAQIEFMNGVIEREEAKARSLEMKARQFAHGSGDETEEHVLDFLNSKVKEVYKRCVGDNDAQISTLQMLTNIENRLEELFERIESLPGHKVEQAEKRKDKERRQRLREEKIDQQRQLQEERVQRALERARAPVRKKTGKAVVFRSTPPTAPKKQANKGANKQENNDDAWLWSM